MSMVRASALSGYSELMRELGGDAHALLERFRISASITREPQAFLAYASLIRLLEHTAKELRCPDFGLRLSTRQDLGILGPLGFAVSNCDNLGDAVRVAVDVRSQPRNFVLPPGRGAGEAGPARLSSPPRPSRPRCSGDRAERRPRRTHGRSARREPSTARWGAVSSLPRLVARELREPLWGTRDLRPRRIRDRARRARPRVAHS